MDLTVAVILDQPPFVGTAIELYAQKQWDMYTNVKECISQFSKTLLNKHNWRADSETTEINKILGGNVSFSFPSPLMLKGPSTIRFQLKDKLLVVYDPLKQFGIRPHCPHCGSSNQVVRDGCGLLLVVYAETAQDTTTACLMVQVCGA
jgi:hypothetical protein